MLSRLVLSRLGALVLAGGQVSAGRVWLVFGVVGESVVSGSSVAHPVAARRVARTGPMSVVVVRVVSLVLGFGVLSGVRLLSMVRQKL